MSRRLSSKSPEPTLKKYFKSKSKTNISENSSEDDDLRSSGESRKLSVSGRLGNMFKSLRKNDLDQSMTYKMKENQQK